MQKAIYAAALVVLATGFTMCTQNKNTDAQTKTTTPMTDQKEKVKSLVSIVEIPTTDFARAISFYESVLAIKIEVMEMDGVKLGMFPNTGDGVFVQLVSGADYKPSGDGTLVYLNGGVDLQNVANKIEAKGGSIVVPKTEIGPDMGFFAMFIDSEGNKLGLHSYK
jgi:uncharacterized protein